MRHVELSAAPTGRGAGRKHDSGRDHFIPAVHFHALTPLYDPLVRWLMPEEALKRRFVLQAGLGAGHGILDLGCGTGTLALMMKQSQPDARIVGLDADPAILGIARRKAAASGADVNWVEGLAHRLPFANGAFDRVVSSLVLHHLSPADKRRAAQEAYRVLRPGGELHVLDFGPPHEPISLALSLVTRWFEQVAENVDGQLPGIFAQAGFADVAEVDHRLTVFGSASFYRARKPERS